MPPRLGPDVPAPLFGAPDRGRGLLVGVVIAFQLAFPALNLSDLTHGYSAINADYRS